MVRHERSVTAIAAIALFACLAVVSAADTLTNRSLLGTNAPSPTPAPTPTPTPSSLKIVQFGPSGTPAQFLSLMKDMTVDVIELQAGTYSGQNGWHALAINVDRTARPLLIRPAAGAAVVWDGAGGQTGTAGLFYVGWSSKTAVIRFDPAGTGGSFTITGYSIGQTGLISTAWCEDCQFNGFIVRNTTAPTTNGQTAWALYLSSDGVHRGQRITANDWDVDNTGTSPTVNGMQLEHSPQNDGVTALRWNVKGGRWAFVGRLDATGLDIEGWTISGTSGPAFDSQGPAGVVKNMHATTSGAPIIQAPMVNSGGNIWQ